MGERVGTLNINGDNIEVDTDSISLFEHKEEPELDHVYVRLPERYNEGEAQRAMYLWRHIGSTATAFALFREAIVENEDVERHFAIRKADDRDREAFGTFQDHELSTLNWNDDPTLW